MRNQTILVDINKETCKILKYKQYDNNNILQIIVEENYKKINLNEYVGFAFFELPSGLIIKKKCEIEDNVITIIIDNNILSEEGKVLLDLTLSDGEDTFTLFRINLVIEETIDRDEAIIIEAGWDIVAEIAKFDKAEERRVDYENVRIANESDRQNEETKRIANENVRIVKENERLSKEIERQNAEELRIENEEGRVGAEVSRVTAEQNRVTRFNEMEAIVSGVDVDITELQNDVSEIQNDMTNTQTQSFTVTDAYKFTVNHDGMMPSLVTLDNIEGLSSVETNTANQKRLVTTCLHDICTIDTSKNYFEDAVFSMVGNNAEYSKEGNNVRVWGSNNFGFMLVTFTIPTLVEGKTYCIICDNVVVTSGSPAIQIPGINLGLGQCKNGHDIDVSGFNGIFRSVGNASILFHCGVHQQTGDVTYENIQIYEVKEMIVPDIRLNSLPNGVKDEIKDGMLIKRTNQVNLKDLKWIVSSTNGGANDYKVYYTHDLTDIKWTTDYDANPNTILCNMLPCTSNAGTAGANDTIAQYQTPGISSHVERSELRIKVKASDAPDLNSLYTWLNNNNVTAVYEMQSYKYEGVNLTIKADKGDTVIINTTKTMDLTYDIQLNTRAQIDSVQDLVSNHKHDEYLPLSGGTITGDLFANRFESIRTVESTDGGGTIGDITKTQVFTDQYGQGRFRVENNSTDTPLIFIVNPYTHSFTINGNFRPSSSQIYDLGSDRNRWGTLYLLGDVNLSNSNFDLKIWDNRIACTTTSLYLRGGETESGIWVNSNAPKVEPDVTNTWHLGSTDKRWTSVYLTSNANVSSDRILKENIEYVNKTKTALTYEDMYNFVKNDLGLATYNFIGDDKLRMNFIAQDLLANEDGSDNKIGQMIVNPVAVPTEEEIAEGKPYPTLSYDSGMYVSVLAGALKEAINKIEQLEEKINELENKK